MPQIRENFFERQNLYRQNLSFALYCLPDMARGRRSRTHDLLVALRHPLRRQILQEMEGGKPTSPRELATKLEHPLSNVSYHVRVLVDCGVLTLVRTKQVRGSTQHFYRSSLKADWAQAALGDAGS
jgi:DNA-binding transcriptional ArsR family regulator